MAYTPTTQNNTPYFTGGNNKAGSIRQSCSPQNDDQEPNETAVTVRASLFFDGTSNNRANTDIGADEVGWGDNLGSYDNDYTNIAKKEKYYEKNEDVDLSFSIYIEGAGTQDRGRDIPQGLATGDGITGVEAKVDKGISKLIENIDTTVDNKKIEYIWLDIFGFSRGAAAARNFIYAVSQKSGTTLLDRLVGLGYSVGAVQVKFVGLYDTVASYGTDHSNDTPELHLDSINLAEYVVQLAAAEEHRKNFQLTNINSAKAGRQIFLPGVHSDIGGGYKDNADEVDMQILDIDRLVGMTDQDQAAFDREKNWLIQSGWYKKDEINGINYWCDELKVTRRGISNLYSHIPLHLMVRFAGEKGVNFIETISDDYPVPPELQEVQEVIDKYIAELGISSPDDWFCLPGTPSEHRSNTEILKRLRHDYLHFSACYGSLMGARQPQWSNDDPIGGERQRRIQNG